jgi:hypothetical protein
MNKPRRPSARANGAALATCDTVTIPSEWLVRLERESSALNDYMRGNITRLQLQEVWRACEIERRGGR